MQEFNDSMGKALAPPEGLGKDMAVLLGGLKSHLSGLVGYLQEASGNIKEYVGTVNDIAKVCEDYRQECEKFRLSEVAAFSNLKKEQEAKISGCIQESLECEEIEEKLMNPALVSRSRTSSGGSGGVSEKKRELQVLEKLEEDFQRKASNKDQQVYDLQKFNAKYGTIQEEFVKKCNHFTSELEKGFQSQVNIFVTGCKDLLLHLLAYPQQQADKQKLEKGSGGGHKKKLLWQEPLAAYDLAGFNYRSWKQLQRLHEASGGLVKSIKTKFSLLSDAQKSRINQLTVQLFSHDISPGKYLDASVRSDTLALSARYLLLFLALAGSSESSTLQPDEVEAVKGVLVDYLIFLFSQPDEDDELLMLLIMKIALALHWYEPESPSFSSPSVFPSRPRKRTLLHQLAQSTLLVSFLHNHLFFLQLFHQNVEYYRMNEQLLHQQQQEEEGEEHALREVLEMMMETDMSIDDMNKLAHDVHVQHGVKKSRILYAFTSLEDDLLLRSRSIKHLKPPPPPVDATISNTPDHISKPITTITSSKHLLRKVLEYSDISTGLNFIQMNRKHREEYEKEWLKEILKRCSITPAIRRTIWKRLVPHHIKQQQLQINLRVDVHVLEQIEMDLNRSKEFIDAAYLPEVHLILLNVAHRYPILTYYQGMNYIAIYLFSLFDKDATAAYHFFAHVIELFVQQYIGMSFQGVLQLLYVIDKLVDIKYPSLAAKLKKGNVSAIHFAVPSIITVFTCMIKNQQMYPLISDVWDCVLACGIPALVSSVLLILELQQQHIQKLSAEQLLVAMKEIEKDPFVGTKPFDSSGAPPLSGGTSALHGSKGSGSPGLKSPGLRITTSSSSASSRAAGGMSKERICSTCGERELEELERGYVEVKKKINDTWNSN